MLTDVAESESDPDPENPELETKGNRDLVPGFEKLPDTSFTKKTIAGSFFRNTLKNFVKLLIKEADRSGSINNEVRSDTFKK